MWDLSSSTRTDERGATAFFVSLAERASLAAGPFFGAHVDAMQPCFGDNNDFWGKKCFMFWVISMADRTPVEGCLVWTTESRAEPL